MNKDDIDLLDKTLAKTNDWLKFAEAKNGAIVAVICTVMFGVNRVIFSMEELPDYLLIYLLAFFILSSLSLVISLCSFIPRLKKPFWLKVEEKSSRDNPFYFGDVCKYDGYSYLKLLGITDSNQNRIVEKLADQIVINSRIAFLKYGLFTTSAWLFVSALITPVGAGFIWMLRE